MSPPQVTRMCPRLAGGLRVTKTIPGRSCLSFCCKLGSSLPPSSLSECPNFLSGWPTLAAQRLLPAQCSGWLLGTCQGFNPGLPHARYVLGLCKTCGPQNFPSSWVPRRSNSCAHGPYQTPEPQTHLDTPARRLYCGACPVCAPRRAPAGTTRPSPC